jgi:hypothetical protein
VICFSDFKYIFLVQFDVNKVAFYSINEIRLKFDRDSGRTIRPGNSRLRVIPVILWKQYSGRKFFPMLSAWFLPESTGSWQESARNTASSDFRCFITGSSGRNHRSGDVSSRLTNCCFFR